MRSRAVARHASQALPHGLFGLVIVTSGLHRALGQLPRHIGDTADGDARIHVSQLGLASVLQGPVGRVKGLITDMGEELTLPFPFFHRSLTPDRWDPIFAANPSSEVITRRRKDGRSRDATRHSRQGQRQTPRKEARRRALRWVIPALTAVGLGLAAWWVWGPAAPETPIPAAGETGEAVTRQLEPTVSAAISSEAPQPQAEASDLKQEAVNVAAEAAAAYPDNALSYALLGSAYYNTGQSEAAIRHLRRCLELDPGQAEAYEILARIAYERGELEESVSLAQEALKRGPPNAEVLNQLGRALMDLGRAGEAIEVLGHGARLPQPTSQTHYLLGQAHLQSGNPARAKECFENAIRLLPDHTQAYFGLYTATVRLGQIEEADRYREQFLKLEEIDRHTLTDRSSQEDALSGMAMVRETVARTFFGAAQIYRFHEDFERAGDLLRKAASLDAETPVYRAALESVYLQRNALEEGAKVFEQLAAEQPDSRWNHFFLGRLYDRLRQVDRAERSYLKVQQLEPGWAEGYRALADLYLRADRLGEAQALARRAAELEPSGPHFYLLALTYLRGKDRASALAAIEQAVAFSPNEVRYQQLLQELRKGP
jgi:tetratricopeptide (TPR) repeat protein